MKITVEDLSFAYVSKQIFTNLNLSFEQGSRTGIMAPTGFGKTTLLHLLAGILDPQAGSITRPERVSLVFQEHRLLPISALANLRCVTNRSEELIQAHLHDLGIPDPTLSIGQMSGGMKRNVSTARAMLYESDFVLIDEPFQGLDTDSRDVLISYILEHLEDRTLIFSTHQKQDIEDLRADLLLIAK